MVPEQFQKNDLLVRGLSITLGTQIRPDELLVLGYDLVRVLKDQYLSRDFWGTSVLFLLLMRTPERPRQRLITQRCLQRRGCNGFPQP